MKQEFDIDMVYLWVNGNDPKWIEKRKACIGDLSKKEENCEGRYVDNDELKYSLRSLEKNAPWIRKIFIVTDNQVPAWIDTLNPKIQIVDHTEILPPESLPCFNSVVIEHHLYRIPGLAEHFLYANDDMYINRPVTPNFFFGQDSLPIVRFNFRAFKQLNFWYKTKVLGKTINNYKETIHNAALLVKRKYGTYYSSKTHHNIDAYVKRDFQHTREVFDKDIRGTLCNHVRSQTDIQRNIYSYVALAEKRGHLHYVTQRTSFRLHIDNRKLYSKFKRYNPILFCMNDSQYANAEDRKYAIAFVKKLFPDKSKFEK